VVEVGLTLRGDPGTVVRAVAVDCACLHVLTSLPVALPASGMVELRFRVTGLRPGIEDVAVATSTGSARAQLQLVGPGAGRGLDQLRAALEQAARQHWRLLALCHDLRGQVRNCGCAKGSLGGAGRLARLPGLARELAPGVTASWVLTGDADGQRSGVAAAVAGSGWRLGEPSVQVAEDPVPLLATPGLTAIVTTGSVPVQHRRIVRPVLTGGMAVELLLLDGNGTIQERRTMPIDADLPDDPALALRFRDPLTSVIRTGDNPSLACASCHATAFAAWSATRHARALDSLPEADRTDGCIGCHTTPIAAKAVAPAVACQSCHAGGEAHAASGGTLRTAGAVDCRSCHDAKHNPGFRREVAWPKIQHGREAATPRPAAETR
jgi:hypothetical protein